MLNIDPVVEVNINVGTSTASTGVFSVGAIIGSTAVSGHFDSSHRYSEYASLAAMADDGFLATSAEYKAAAKYFGVNPAPNKLVMIFCEADPAAEEYDSSKTYNTGDYCTHGTDNTLYTCKEDSVTGAWNASKWDEVTRTTDTPGGALLDALDKGAEFYSVYYIPAESASISSSIGEIVSALDGLKRGILFYGVTGSATDAAAQGGLMDTMYNLEPASARQRAIGMLCTDSVDDAAGLMGVAMGLALEHESGSFALCYKTVASAKVNNITQEDVDRIKALNGNVYVQRSRTRSFVENGATASGLRFDDVLYLDRMAYDIQQGIYELIADSPTKLPQIDSTSAIFVNEIGRILDNYYNYGVLAEAEWRGRPVGEILTGDYIEHGHTEFADSFATQSEADRALRKAMPITVLLCLSGSVESIVINVNVQT